MQAIKNQLPTDLQKISAKLNLLHKLSLKSWLLLSMVLLTSVGLLVGFYATRQSTEDRSSASGNGAQLYFSPASVVLTKNAAGELQPVTFEVKTTAGRPISNYSFVIGLTDSSGNPLPRTLWNDQVTFGNNHKFLLNTGAWLEHNPTNSYAFYGTIGQKPNGVTTLAHTVTDGKIGTITFRPVANQTDVKFSFYVVPNKPEANAVYVLGSLLTPHSADGEVRFSAENFANEFNIHNPFLVSTTPSPTPAVSDVGPARLQYAASSSGIWQQLPNRFDRFNLGGTIKSLIRVNDIDPTWRVAGLSPAFRLRIKNAQGVYKQTTINGETTNVLVNYQPNGSLASGQFWVNWNVVGNSNELKFIQMPGTTNKLQFDPGDTVEVTINLRREQNGVSYVCKENNQLIVAPIGRPEEEEILGPCRNNSLVTVTYAEGIAPNTCQCDLGVVMNNACYVGVTATCTSQVACACTSTGPSVTPTPTTRPSATPTPTTSPNGSPTPTPTVAPTPYVPQVSVNYRMSTAENWTAISGPTNTFEFRPGMTLRMNLNRGSVRPLYSSLPAGTSDIAAFRLRIFDQNNQQRGSTLVHEGIIGASGNFIQDYKITTVNSTNMITVLDSSGQPISGQTIQFNNGDKLDIRVNMKWLESSIQQVSSCTEGNQYVKYPNGRPNEQVVIGPCLNQSIKNLIWSQ